MEPKQISYWATQLKTNKTKTFAPNIEISRDWRVTKKVRRRDFSLPALENIKIDGYSI